LEPIGFLARSVARRPLIRRSLLGAAGLAGAALIGCDDDDDATAGTATATATGAATGTATATTEGEEPDYVRLARADGAPYAYNFPEPAEQPKAGGVFRYAQISGHSPFDPITSGGATTESADSLCGNFLVGYNVGPTLSKYQMELNADNGLATSWEASPDGLTYTFDIREANFHNIEPANGRALVANDVKLAFERMFGGRQGGLLSTIEAFDAPDERTVVMTMKIPNPDILVVLGNRAMPIYAPEMYDAGIQDTTPIGTGPAIFDPSKTVKDQVMAFTSNPDYWGGAPLLDGIELVTVPDDATRVATFRTGQTHAGLSTVLPDEEAALFGDVPGMQVTSDPNLMGIQLYAVNSNIEPFSDVRVRRGIKLAMNVEKYISILFPQGAEAFPAFGWPFLFDEKPGADKFGAYWPHDPDEARKLIAAAGAEGTEWEHIGPSQFSGSTVSGDSLIAEDMSEVGLTMKLKNIDFSEFNTQYYGRAFADPATAAGQSIAGFSTASPTANGYFWENVHSQSSTNHFAVADPRVDELADAQRSEIDPARRREIQLELYDYFNDQAYFMDKYPITWSNTYIRPEVRFYRFNAPYIGIHWFWDWGYGYHKAWLGEALSETPSIRLR
jgi:peptide/nickel transport system substrate-binding protein